MLHMMQYVLWSYYFQIHCASSHTLLHLIPKTSFDRVLRYIVHSNFLYSMCACVAYYDTRHRQTVLHCSHCFESLNSQHIVTVRFNYHAKWEYDGYDVPGHCIEPWSPAQESSILKSTPTAPIATHCVSCCLMLRETGWYFSSPWTMLYWYNIMSTDIGGRLSLEFISIKGSRFTSCHIFLKSIILCSIIYNLVHNNY